MNSLMWCIYGETSHGVKGDDVLSTGHEKNCRVKVTIEDEGKRYAIIRHRKHKEFKNRLIVRGEDGDMTKGKDSLTRGVCRATDRCVKRSIYGIDLCQSGGDA